VSSKHKPAPVIIPLRSNLGGLCDAYDRAIERANHFPAGSVGRNRWLEIAASTRAQVDTLLVLLTDRFDTLTRGENLLY